MKFRDGTVARREVVAGGAVYDTAQTQLTPILLALKGELPSSLDNCLLSEGKPVRVSAVENPTALVIFVRDPDEHEAQLTVGRFAALRIRLDYDTSMRMLWPIPQKFADAHSASLLFEATTDVDATRLSLGGFLTHAYNGRYVETPLQLADAVAVAGIRVISETRRRAVVLVLGNQKDQSRHDPAAVRRYLADIGVPFFVWSLNGPHPEWDEVEDISTPMGLQSAAQSLRKTLAAQRIAWVEADPLSALRLRADERCGVATVARLGVW